MMENRESLLQRYGGHIALFVVALLFVLGWRWSLAGAALDVEAPLSSSQASSNSSPSQTGPSPQRDTSAQPAVTPTETPSVDMDEVPVIDDYSLSPALNPHTYQGSLPQHEFITYTVQRNDAPISIAEKFAIKPETLLGGNPFLSEESSLLQTGTVLTILPVDGVLHDVQQGETLEGLAEQYGIPIEEIVAYEPNNLEFPYRLYPETQILVPGAVRELFVWTPPQLPSRATSNSYWAGQAPPVVVGTGTFIWPVGGRSLSQVYWYGHQGIDVTMGEGSAVYASDTGTVTYAAWSAYCFGNLIVINHGNGAETFYAHLSSIGVVPGQIVYQGNYIGATGNTGCSSGPHIHFEIRWNGVRDNPMGWLP